MRPKPIVPSLYHFIGPFMGRSYLLCDRETMTIIDTGSGGAFRWILRQIRGLGREPEAVGRILLTHAHSGHIGSLKALVDATGAAVLSSPAERPFVEGRRPILRGGGKPGVSLIGAPVSGTLEDGERLPVFGALVAVHAPGHTPGQTMYWQPERRILFCGDVILHVLGLRLPPASSTVAPRRNLRAIARMVALEPRIVCFGHGRPLITETLSTLRRFAREVGAIGG